MLNYVWLGLIILGLTAALSSDISDSTSNKYRNENSFQASFTPSDENGLEKNKSFDGTLTIDKNAFSKFYDVKVEEDVSINAKISFADKLKEATLFFKINENSPEIWKKIAAVNGKNDDISGVAVIQNKIAPNEFLVSVKLESVSLIKMKEITNAALSYAETAVNISLGLIGIMALWLGVMKIAEEAGLITYIARALKPITKFLFPDVPTEHPAMGSMIMNISANFLGLGNAATPFGLKAMEELDKLNPEKGTASNAMCTFLAINTAGLTLIPATAIAIRASAGSTQPAVIIGTALFGSLCATTVAITSAKIFEKFSIPNFSFINFFKSNLKTLLKIFGVILSILILYLTGVFAVLGNSLPSLNADFLKQTIQLVSTLAIPFLIFIFVGFGFLKKVKVYESFVEGAKEGFNVAVRIIPYLVAMLMAIGIFRSGGAMDWLVYILRPITDFVGMPAEALPMALMRPLSGSGSLGIMAEIISVHGPDSFLGILVSTFYGSTETTFYVLAVYFGAVNIKKTRHALPAGILADIAGILAALFIVRLLFL